MRYCAYCGTAIEDGQIFCANCGAAVEAAPATIQPTAQPISQTPAEYPMKWFKFLIYFSLFFGAVINLINGINTITGNIYVTQSFGQITAAQVYQVFGQNLKMVDTLYGIALIIMAGLSVYTRFRLAGYKEDGPKWIYILYGAGAALTLVYSIAAGSIVGELDFTSILPSLIVSCLMLFLNYKYFSRRAELFVK